MKKQISSIKNIKINFHYEIEKFFIEEKKITQWISKIISLHSKKPKELNIIFCNDAYLLDINKQYLQHDYYTDIITFQHDPEQVYGDLYISIDRVNDNAIELHIDAEWELLRVIIHGVLHLIGFKDKTKKEQQSIRDAEDAALAIYKQDFLLENHYYDQVYDVVSRIPVGRVTNYGAIADYLALGSARMVGWALNNLKQARDHVPAHRVVNARGELSGRLYFGENRMAQLLESEGVEIVDDKIQDFKKYFWQPE